MLGEARIILSQRNDLVGTDGDHVWHFGEAAKQIAQAAADQGHARFPPRRPVGSWPRLAALQRLAKGKVVGVNKSRLSDLRGPGSAQRGSPLL